MIYAIQEIYTNCCESPKVDVVEMAMDVVEMVIMWVLRGKGRKR